MNYKLNKNILNLRKQLFSQFSELQKENIASTTNSEMESIDSILATLMTFNITFENIEDELKEENELLYYEFIDNVKDIKDDVLNLALELKQEIIEKLYDNNQRFKDSHKEICPEISNNIEISWSTSVHNQFVFLKDLSYVLKDQLSEYKNLKFKNLNTYMLEMQKLYNSYQNIFESIRDENYLEFDEDDEIDEENNDTWESTSYTNYDITLLEDIYITTFGEETKETNTLIGIMISDFYEYHKCNLDMYDKFEDKDKIDIIKKIEESNLKELIKYFHEEPNWSLYILDSFIYYNINFSSKEKLENRKKIIKYNKLDILKKYNPFITDDLIDQTLYNTFITPLSSLIRITNDNLETSLITTYKKDIDKLLMVYFNTNFTPKSINTDIPEEIKDINIKELKNLQLKFIISDFISREIHNNNKDVNRLLQENPASIVKIVRSDGELFSRIINNYINNIDNDKEITLNKEEKKK